MVSAGRVTVPPAFTLRLLSHLVTKAAAVASSGAAVAGAVKEEEEAVMQLIHAVGAERLGEAAASGSGRRSDTDERLSLQVQWRGGERGVEGWGGPADATSLTRGSHSRRALPPCGLSGGRAPPRSGKQLMTFGEAALDFCRAMPRASALPYTHHNSPPLSPPFERSKAKRH